MLNQDSFGDDTLDIRDLIEKEETILDATDAPDADDWAFLQQMKELRNEFFSPIDVVADDDPTLILSDYLAEWAETYAADVTNLDTTEWPFSHIDWEAAAEDLTVDMSEVSVGEYTYYSRGG